MCLGSLFCWKVNLLPVWGSECSGDWVFIKAISIFWCIELFFYSDESLSPCCWKTAPQHEAATSTLYFWDVLCRWWAELVSFKHDAWNWGSSDQIMLFLTVWGSFRCFFANSKYVFMCLHWREDWALPHCHKAQIGGVLQWCLSFCRFLLSAYGHGAEVEWPSGSSSPL